LASVATAEAYVLRILPPHPALRLDAPVLHILEAGRSPGAGEERVAIGKIRNQPAEAIY